MVLAVIDFTAEARENDINIKYGFASLKVSFQRTIRVPDNDGLSKLPPDLGNFPLYRVSEHADNMPAAMAKKGGVFLPMYREFIHNPSTSID